MEELDLTKTITLDQTTRAGYNDESPADNYFVDENTSEAESALDALLQETAEEAQVVDTTDYSTKFDYIKFDTKDLLKVMTQLSAIIDTNSKRAVSRGISIKVVDDKHIDIISPNELYYFKTTLESENTLPVDTTIFIEYIFIQKISRFLASKIRIAYDTDKERPVYTLKTKRSELELKNTNLIDSDLERLKMTYEITDKVCEADITSLYNSLFTLSKVLRFESDSPRRYLTSQEGNLTFKSPLVFAAAKSDLLDITLRQKDIDYLIKAAKVIKSGTPIEVYATTSELTRYAFVYGTTTMVTNYSQPKQDVRILSLLKEQPNLVEIDFTDLKLDLEYANSITYAFGTVNLSNIEGHLQGDIKLEGGGTSPFTIKTLSPIDIPENETIKINTKTLLNSLNALNPTMKTYIGYSKDKVLYLVNDDVTLMLITI